MNVDRARVLALARWAASKNLARAYCCDVGDEMVDEHGLLWVCVGRLLFQRLVYGEALRGTVTPFSPRRWVVRYPAARMY